jgi:hypothetical protein
MDQGQIESDLGWANRRNIERSEDGKEDTGRSVEDIDRQILEENRGSWKHSE